MNPNAARRFDRLVMPACRLAGLVRRPFRAPAAAVTAATPLPPAPDGATVVLKVTGLGSLTLLAPALHAYAARTGRVTRLVTATSHRELLDLFNWPLELVYLDDQSPWAALASAWPGLRAAAAPPVGAVLDLEFYSAAGTLFGELLRPRLHAGLSAPWRAHLLTHLVPWPEGVHLAEVAWSCLSQLAGENLPRTHRLPLAATALPPPPPRLEGERVRVVVNVNTGPLCPERRLPLHLMAGLLTGLAAERPVSYHLTGTAAEQPAVAEVLRRLPPQVPAVSYAGRLGLAELLSLLGSADLVISNDSGPLHLAAGVGARTMSFFGPETPGRFGPLGDGHTVVVGQVPCGPCLTADNLKRAPCGGRNVCLGQLTPDQLIPLATRALDGAGGFHGLRGERPTGG